MRPRPKHRPIALKERGGAGIECQKLRETALLDENLIVGEKGGMANVFVYVKKGLAKKSYPLPEQPAVLDQVKCMFRPRVQGGKIVG